VVGGHGSLVLRIEGQQRHTTHKLLLLVLITALPLLLSVPMPKETPVALMNSHHGGRFEKLASFHLSVWFLHYPQVLRVPTLVRPALIGTHVRTRARKRRAHEIAIITIITGRRCEASRDAVYRCSGEATAAGKRRARAAISSCRQRQP
jgi:hypothetical protein